MFPSLRQWLVLAACLLAFVPGALAQQTESRIIGRILDQSGATMPGATVTVTSLETGAVRTDVADGDGNVTITNLGPGRYEIKAELDGFQPSVSTPFLGLVGLSAGLSAGFTSLLPPSFAGIAGGVAPPEPPRAGDRSNGAVVTTSHGDA